jgi:hypothetical protein
MFKFSLIFCETDPTFFVKPVLHFAWWFFEGHIFYLGFFVIFGTIKKRHSAVRVGLQGAPCPQGRVGPVFLIVVCAETPFIVSGASKLARLPSAASNGEGDWSGIDCLGCVLQTLE